MIQSSLQTSGFQWWQVPASWNWTATSIYCYCCCWEMLTVMKTRKEHQILKLSQVLQILSDDFEGFPVERFRGSSANCKTVAQVLGMDTETPWAVPLYTFTFEFEHSNILVKYSARTTAGALPQQPTPVPESPESAGITILEQIFKEKKRQRKSLTSVFERSLLRFHKRQDKFKSAKTNTQYKLLPNFEVIHRNL